MAESTGPILSYLMFLRTLPKLVGHKAYMYRETKREVRSNRVPKLITTIGFVLSPCYCTFPLSPFLISTSRSLFSLTAINKTRSLPRNQGFEFETVVLCSSLISLAFTCI